MHTIARTDAGDVFVWGTNEHGVLGFDDLSVDANSKRVATQDVPQMLRTTDPPPLSPHASTVDVPSRVSVNHYLTIGCGAW